MKDIADISLDDVKSVMANKGYKVFTEEGIPNIVGIRNTIKKTDNYIDRCFVWWIENGAEVSHDYTITTRDGAYYLENPINDKGSAILVPDQYINCWELGMHRGKQFALCQKDGVVRVYRDNNQDDIIDCNPASEDVGYFGIDLHHAGTDDSPIIGKWSAGCQVWRYNQRHQDLMNKFKELSEKNKYKKFTYTLLLQEDFF